MTSDLTQQQSSDEQRRAEALSRQGTVPPATIPGYEMRRFLGAGAYGEVWVAIDKNTGRQVAVKYYTHRGGVDWTLLTREVEKLVMLSADRYVVQLLGVGWDSDPPHYIMEYVEQGSLEDYLRQRGPLPPQEAAEIFREIVLGLSHAHDKGILHCDLKPANVLLDQDHKPRLADFGQSRLSHDQTPALGTLFYMAPEQADLTAVPDARWDVYALGAVLYAMLCGAPPHRNDDSVSQIESAADLPDRLARYRAVVGKTRPESVRRLSPAVDRELAEIAERCLAADPAERFPNVQAVQQALAAREAGRARRPLVLLGFVGPLLLLLVMSLFAWRGYQQAVTQAKGMVSQQTQESNRFAAKFAAEMAARELATYIRAVEFVARDERFQRALAKVQDDEELRPHLRTIGESSGSEAEIAAATQAVVDHAGLAALDEYLVNLRGDPQQPEASSWFVTDERGTHLAAAFDRPPRQSPIGRNFAYRAYFHGGAGDLQPSVRPTQHIERTHLSPVFLSTATNTWKIAVSTPVYAEEGKRFLGVAAASVDISRFMKFEGDESQFAAIIDTHPGENYGLIVQHPYLTKSDPTRRFRVDVDRELGEEVQLYRDPVGDDPQGGQYARPWIAAKAPVRLIRPQRDANGGAQEIDAHLLLVVQQDYEEATRPVRVLSGRLLRDAVWAVVVISIVVAGMWWLVWRAMVGPKAGVRPPRTGGSGPTPAHDFPTVESREIKRAPGTP